MGNKKLVLFVVLSSIAMFAKAQEIDYQTVDSISTVKYLNGDWRELITYGDKAIHIGNDFLVLRLRLGYANFQIGNYSKALAHYQKALADDSKNETALAYAYLANTYLNRIEEAGYLASTQHIENVKIKPYSAIDLGIEAGLKFSGIATRGNSTYTRLSFTNRLGYRLTLAQSISYFNQQVFTSSINQYEYYGKLSYVPIKNVLIKGAFHYLNSSDFSGSYHNGLGFLALSYQFPFISPQLDFSFGKVNDIQTNQYALSLTYYPLGNLNLYGISRLSQKDIEGNKELVFSQILGVKLSPSFWVEGLVTAGDQNHFADADNLYIFNGIDATKLKVGGSLYYLINSKLKLSLNYTNEQKTESTLLKTYNQNSLTTGLTWKF